MGPFVPNPISEPLNLLVALFLGIAFGFVLEQAGFSSSRRLAGVFYGYDFTVLRVFFTAAVTAMSGVLLLGYFGLLEVEAIFVNPTWLNPALLGGVIMGLGFILGGYCPGTSICAAAIGKVDAFFFVGGGLLGVLIFGEAYPLLKTFNESSALGSIKVYESLGLGRGLFAFLLIIAAVGAFAVTTRIERKVAGDAAPSSGFISSRHLFAGLGAVLLGLILIGLPDYQSRILRRVSSPAYAGKHSLVEMEPDELAFRLLDRESHLVLLDLRDPVEFKSLALPGSINTRVVDLFGRELAGRISERRVKKVILGRGEAEARQAALVLHELGFENLVILKGGFTAFDRQFLHPLDTAPESGRWAKDVEAFRIRARQELPRLIEAAKASKTKTPKVEKKIQGGC